MQICIPSDSECVGHFDAQKLVSTKYKMHLFKSALKPLSIAEKVSIRIDKNDILCVQYMVKVEEQKSFLEYICLPEVE